MIELEFLVRPSRGEDAIADDVDAEDDPIEASKPTCALVASRRAITAAPRRCGSGHDQLDEPAIP